MQQVTALRQPKLEQGKAQDSRVRHLRHVSSVRLKVEQDQLVIGDGWIGLGSIGLQGA